MENTNGSVSKTGQTQNSKKRGLLIAIVVAVVLVIAVLVGVIIYLMTKPAEIVEAKSETTARTTVLTEDNVEEVLSEAATPVEAGYYNCQMNVEWSFVDSSQPSYNAYVANSTINTHTVYFDLHLEDSGELIYSSPYIPVGAELTDITLDADLPAGEYPAVVVYHLVDDNQQVLSTVSVTVTLYIEQ